MIPRLVFLMTALLTAGCTSTDDPLIPHAVADIYEVSLRSDSSYSIGTQQIGQVEIVAFEDHVQLQVTVQGLTPNYRHALHLHTGSCEDPGPHWNQGTTANFCETLNLGQVWARPKAGDVGNVNTDGQGSGSLVVESELWTVGTGDATDLLGAVLVVHEDPENFDRECFENHMHAHANPKIACGRIASN